MITWSETLFCRKLVVRGWYSMFEEVFFNHLFHDKGRVLWHLFFSSHFVGGIRLEKNSRISRMWLGLSLTHPCRRWLIQFFCSYHFGIILFFMGTSFCNWAWRAFLFKGLLFLAEGKKNSLYLLHGRISVLF